MQSILSMPQRVKGIIADMGIVILHLSFQRRHFRPLYWSLHLMSTHSCVQLNNRLLVTQLSETLVYSLYELLL